MTWSEKTSSNLRLLINHLPTAHSDMDVWKQNRENKIWQEVNQEQQFHPKLPLDVCACENLASHLTQAIQWDFSHKNTQLAPFKRHKKWK